MAVENASSLASGSGVGYQTGEIYSRASTSDNAGEASLMDA